MRPVPTVGVLWLLTLPVFWTACSGRAPAPDCQGDSGSSSAVVRSDADGPAAPLADLESQCRRMAEWLAGQLGPECRVVVRPPYVVGGDASEAELEQYHRRKIEPAARAMADRYAWVRPSEPVIVVLLSSPDSYRRLSEKLSGRKSGSSSGYYQDHLRMAVVNTARGDAGLYHELTHALLAFDCPGAPPWLSEGLAALHETARTNTSGVDLTGRDNARLTVLQEAIRRGELASLEALFQRRDFHDRQEWVHYACARYICLYLEEQGVLRQCYARLRHGIDADPSGSQAIAAVLPGRSWDQLNAEFRAWVLARTAPEPTTGGE